MARGTSFVNIMTVDSINQVLDFDLWVWRRGKAAFIRSEDDRVPAAVTTWAGSNYWSNLEKALFWNEDTIIYCTLIRPIYGLYMNWLTSSCVLSKWLCCCFVQTAPAWAVVMVAGRARMGLLRRVDTATFVTHGAWWLASCCAGPGVLTIQQPGTAGISKGTNRHSLHRLCWCAPWVRGLPSQL